MSDSETGQVNTRAAEVYEEFFIPVRLVIDDLAVQFFGGLSQVMVEM